MRIVIKVGGTLLDEIASRVQLAAQFAHLAKKHSLVVVHGGGKQVSSFLAAQGIQSRFVRGLRVSDEAVVDAVTKIIAGGVNKQLVAAVVSAGQPAVGICGIDGPLTVADQLDPELGFVGRPVRTDGRLLDVLVDAGFTPVIACVAGSLEGQIYNVNADQMAVSCAIGWKADKLFFLTDVAGVKDASGTVIPCLSPSDVDTLVDSGVAQGGMQAKLGSSVDALESGLSEVVIASGREIGVCQRLLDDQTLGTRLVPSGKEQ